MNIEDDAEGEGSRRPAAKLRLRRPLPAGQGPQRLETIAAPRASAMGMGSRGADTHRGLLVSAKSVVLDGGLGLYSDLLLRGYVHVEIIRENGDCCAAPDGHGADPPRVVPALPLEAAKCSPADSSRHFFKIRKKIQRFNLFQFSILVIWINSDIA